MLEYLILSIILILVIALMVFRKNPYVKKYWRISLILIPFAILIILKIISDLKRQKPSTGGQPTGNLEGQIQEIKEQITDIQIETTAEVAVAKTKNEEMIKKLEEIKNISDRAERRRRLIALIG